ncbi:tRNA methyltransferase 10 homolog A [Lampetra fluviatilis]
MDEIEEHLRETPGSGGEEVEEGSCLRGVPGEMSSSLEAAAAAVTEEPGDGGVSKRQRKKMLRQKQWEDGREQRRLQRKERRQRRKQEGGEEPARKRVHAEPEPSGVRVAIDCGFDDLMLLRDVKKLHKQIQRCYAENRRATHSVQLLLTSHSGQLKTNMDMHDRGYLNWKGIEVRGERVEEAVPTAELVYLTSESPHTLASVESGRTYVIGGLVDHNHHKGLTLQKAEELRVEHARLPLDDYVKMSSRKVLTVNHVFEIILAYLDLGDWRGAFLRVLPDRKQVVPITHKASPPATSDENGCRGATAAAVVVEDRERHCRDDGGDAAETGGPGVNPERRESVNLETGDSFGLEMGDGMDLGKSKSVNPEMGDPVNPVRGDPDVNPEKKESVNAEIRDSLRPEMGDDAVNLEKRDSVNV